MEETEQASCSSLLRDVSDIQLILKHRLDFIVAKRPRSEKTNVFVFLDLNINDLLI